MKTSVPLVMALAAANLSVAAFAGPPPMKITTAALMGLQSRSYPVAAKVAFNAALSALQNQGYTEIIANRDAGTISAFADSKAKTIFNIFHGFGKKKWTLKSSILVEDQGVGATVRLNLVAGETKQRASWGGTFSDAEIVRAPDPYIDFFGQLDAEIERRGGGSKNPVTFTPDNSGRIDLGGVRLRPAKTLSGFCIEGPSNYQGTGSANMPTITEARPLCI